jgi:hypothetical protein
MLYTKLKSSNKARKAWKEKDTTKNYIIWYVYIIVSANVRMLSSRCCHGFVGQRTLHSAFMNRLSDRP